jgi:hypothetical protein
LGVPADETPEDYRVDNLPGILSGVSTLILFVILGGTLWKVMQISSDLSEVKEMVQDLRRTNDLRIPTPVEQAASAPFVPVPTVSAPLAPPPVPVAPTAAHLASPAAPPPLALSQGPISPEDLVRAVHERGYDAIAAEVDLTPPRS